MHDRLQVQEGLATDQIFLVHEGEVECVVGDERTVVDVVKARGLGWIGEMTFLMDQQDLDTTTPLLPKAATASCITAVSSNAKQLKKEDGTGDASVDTVTLVAWKVDDFKALLKHEPAIALAVHSSLGAAVAGKLRRKLRREVAMSKTREYQPLC